MDPSALSTLPPGRCWPNQRPCSCCPAVSASSGTGFIAIRHAGPKTRIHFKSTKLRPPFGVLGLLLHLFMAQLDWNGHRHRREDMQSRAVEDEQTSCRAACFSYSSYVPIAEQVLTYRSVFFAASRASSGLAACLSAPCFHALTGTDSFRLKPSPFGSNPATFFGRPRPYTEKRRRQGIGFGLPPSTIC